MKFSDLEPTWAEIYWQRFRANVHQLLVWGYQDARCKIGSREEEENITGFLAQAIKERLCAAAAPEWSDHYSAHENEPVPGGKRKGKGRKRPDLIIELTSRPRLEYVFEAKRLKKKTHLISDYVGREGLQCFLREEYAANYLEAGMLGYVQSDNPEEWSKKLKDLMRGTRGIKLRPKGLIDFISIVAELSDEWVSEHERDSGRTIKIYHILLDCT